MALLTSPAAWLLVTALLLPVAGRADLQIRRSNPEGLSQPDGYSQLVTVEGPARTIFLGGKAGIYPDGSFPPTLAEQSRQTFHNIRTALEAAGATPEDVVDIQIYIVDLASVDPEPVYNDVRSFFPAGHKPTSMVIGVSALAYPGLLVEINVTAMVAE
jgi:enamine deaminase RidA (YjgF/YER057c/UK114 family)